MNIQPPDDKADMLLSVRTAQAGSSPYSHDDEIGAVVSIESDAVQKIVARRLKEARIAAGYRSPKDFATASEVNPTTYYHHENGRRAIRADVARRYAKLLRLPAGTLMYGENLQSATTIPIVGCITRDGRVTMSAEGMALQQVEFPNRADMIGYNVQGQDLYPAYRDGDMVFHRKMIKMTKPSDLQRVHGLECIVELADGSLLLRQVAIQADGNATLFGYAVAPMINQRVVRAAPVEYVRRALPQHLEMPYPIAQGQ